MTKGVDVWLITSYRNSNYDPESNRLIRASLKNADISYNVFYNNLFWQYSGQLYYGLKKIKYFPKIAIIRYCPIWLREFMETKQEIIKINGSASRTLIMNKISCHDLLTNHNILQPKYLTWQENITYENTEKEPGETFIVKDAHGSLGAQVFLVNKQSEFDSAISGINKKDFCFSSLSTPMLAQM